MATKDLNHRVLSSFTTKKEHVIPSAGGWQTLGCGEHFRGEHSTD
jgi:hypothetical protein